MAPEAGRTPFSVARCGGPGRQRTQAHAHRQASVPALLVENAHFCLEQQRVVLYT